MGRIAVNIPIQPTVPTGRRPEFWRSAQPEIREKTVVKGGMWHPQRAWWLLPNFYRMFVGGYGCVSGETVVGDTPIAERTTVGPIETLWGPAFGSSGYLKGQAELYRVSTQLGHTVVVTAAHRFLTPHGWHPLSKLAVGVVIAGSVFEDDRRWKRRGSGSSDRCWCCSRRCDESQSHEVAPVQNKTSQSWPPSTFGLCPCKVAFLHARTGCDWEEDLQLLEVGLSPRSVGAPDERIHKRRSAFSRSLGWSDLGGNQARPDPMLCEFGGGDTDEILSPGLCTEVLSYPPTVPAWDEIRKIEFVRFGDFYDLSVPGAEHYLAHGLWHHNSGKTMNLCKRAVGVALENSPFPYLLVSPSYQMARKTTIATMNMLLEGKRRIYGDANFAWRYHKTEHEYRITHLGRTGYVWIASGDNPDSLRGPNVAAAGLDEAFIQERAVFDQVVARIRIAEAKIAELDIVGTPEMLGWGFELAEGEIADDVGVVHASTRDNLALMESYADRLYAALDEQVAKAYVEGQFVHLGKGLKVHAFDPAEHVVELRRPANAKLVAGMDFNVDPMAASVAWVHEKHMHIFYEIELPNSDTEEMCGLLKERYWEEGLREIYPDPTGNKRQTTAAAGVTDMVIIKRFGFTVKAPKAPWSRRDRFNAVNGKLKPRDGRISLTISPKCKKLKRYWSMYSSDNENKEAGKAASHLIDASSYPIVYLFPIKRDWSKMVKIRGT